MKSFKQYISDGKGYPDSYEKNKTLMSLVQKYNDPLKFLLAVMTAMSSGKLKLRRIGIASTREVAALWNAHNKGKKISSAMIEQYIAEASQSLVKGWTLKNKVVSVTSNYDNYHIKQVFRKASKFGLTKQKLMKMLEDYYDGLSAPDPEKEAETGYDDLYSGEWDNNVAVEEYLHKKGYCAFVIDKAHGSIVGQTEKECRASAKVLEDMYFPFEKDGFKLFEIKPTKGRPKYITSKYDWNVWISGKKAGGNRSEIGSTMAQFREEESDENI